MNLQTATIVAGSETPAGAGTTGALRCVIALPDGTRRAAVLKRGALEHVTAEVFCALVLRAWGLGVPEPFLIVEIVGGPAFASADEGYPNLSQYLAVDAIPAGPQRDAALRLAMDVACSLSSAPLAIVCDEAIDNRDRNLGNILWDGTTSGWIDHAFAAGNGLHMPDANKLCIMATGTRFEDGLKRGAVAQALVLDRGAPQAVEAALSATPLKASAMTTLIAARLANLAGRVIARFPQPNDLLAQQP